MSSLLPTEGALFLKSVSMFTVSVYFLTCMNYLIAPEVWILDENLYNIYYI